MKNGDYLLVKAPDNFPGKKYRGKYCYEHILIFWQTYGILPNKNEVIHHKDGNKHNNVPSNLELKTRSGHTRDHSNGKTYVQLRCPGCNKVFIKEKRNSYLIKKTKVSCCSRKCVGIYTGLNNEVKQQREKNMFIKEFVK